jgi:nitrite reductase (NADH) small subunit
MTHAGWEGRFVRFAARSAIPSTRALVRRVGTYEIAVFSLGDGFVAYENVCPHQGGPIGEGVVEDTTVTCPWHGWCFDLRDGSMTIGDFARLRRFAVYVADDALFVSAQPEDGVG